MYYAASERSFLQDVDKDLICLGRDQNCLHSSEHSFKAKSEFMLVKQGNKGVHVIFCPLGICYIYQQAMFLPKLK